VIEFTRNEKNVKYFQKGGNERLKAFFEKYKIQDFPIEKKYRTKAASYYRDKVKNCKKFLFILNKFTKKTNIYKNINFIMNLIHLFINKAQL